MSTAFRCNKRCAACKAPTRTCSPSAPLNPSFKKRGERQSARYTKSGFKLTDGRRLAIGKLGVLRIRWDRNLPAEPGTVTIIREATDRYYLSFVVQVDVKPLPMTGKSVGIDFGLARLATLSTGKTISNPKHSYKRGQRLAFLQRNLARKQISSKRRMLAKRAVARCNEKISKPRKDALNKLTTRLVSEFDVIMIEDLHLRGIGKNHALARSLSDAGIGMAM